jgi:hypothetical protein
MNYICTFCNYSTEDKRNYYRHLKTDRHQNNQTDKSNKDTILNFQDTDTKANLLTKNKPKNTKVSINSDIDLEIDINSVHTILSVLMSINKGSLENDINKYIAPFFNLVKKNN